MFNASQAKAASAEETQATDPNATRLIPTWEPLLLFFLLLLCPDVLVCLVMTFMLYSRAEWRSVQHAVQSDGVRFLTSTQAEVQGPVTRAVHWIQHQLLPAFRR